MTYIQNTTGAQASSCLYGLNNEQRSANKVHIEVDRLYEIFECNFETGEIRWKISPRIGVPVGTIAGTLSKDGYRRIGIEGSYYLAHRIVFAMFYRRWPVGQLDHNDADNRDKNKVLNLREASNKQNACNKRISPKNTSGVAGVRWEEKHNRWLARIQNEGVTKNLGRYINKTDAILAVDLARLQLHGLFARLNDPGAPFVASDALFRLTITCEEGSL
jgi:hypothetical protein